MLLRRALAAVLLAAALLAGCGVDDDRGPQTKEGFIAAADNVCQDLFSEFAQAGEGQPSTPAGVAAANKDLAETYAKLVERLEDVRLPDEARARRGAAAFVRSVRAAEPLLDRLRTASTRFVDAAQKKDRGAITKAGSDVRTQLDAFRSARADSDRLAISYGLNFCGNLG